MNIAKETERAKESTAKASAKRQAWMSVADRAEEVFREVVETSKSSGYPDSLYIIRDDSLRTVQLFSGESPIDVTHLYNEQGLQSGLKVHTEQGAALVISQAVTGDTSIMLFPHRSEKCSRNVGHIVLAVYENPIKISQRTLRSAVNDMFVYMRVSSARQAESWRDRARVGYLEWRSRKYSSGYSLAKTVFSHWFWVLLGALGSIASIYSVCNERSGG